VPAWAIALFGLTALGIAPLYQLSGGEQQMLAIGRALTTNPGMLLMDEPLEGLSPGVVSEVLDLIRKLKKDRIPVLLVEQRGG
jgi:branched-chain amino acid transport system ATP-binding protein